MKLRVLIILILACVLVIAETRQLQPNPRVVRGFKNPALSTARGFGKRTPLDTADELNSELAARKPSEQDLVLCFYNTWCRLMLRQQGLMMPSYHQNAGEPMIPITSASEER